MRLKAIKQHAKDEIAVELISPGNYMRLARPKLVHMDALGDARDAENRLVEVGCGRSKYVI